MHRYITGLLIFFFVFTFAQGVSAGAGGEKKAEKVLKSIGFGYSEEAYFFPKKPANRELEMRTRKYIIGNEKGTNFHYSRGSAEVSQSGSTRWFAIPVHTEEYGVEVAARFSTRPRLSLSLGFGRKEIESDTFIDKWYVTSVPAGIEWICRPDDPCEDTLWWAPVVSNPFVIGLSLKPGDRWRVDLKMRREKLEIQTAAKPSENVKLYSLKVSRKWGDFDAGLLVERLRADRAPSNRHVEAQAAYDFWKGAKIFMQAGYYSSGLPLSSHPLSDIGAKFIFEYLGGEDKLTPLYTQKIGYYSLGIDYTLSF